MVEPGDSSLSIHRSSFQVGTSSVSSLLLRPADATCLYVFGHGAGAGMWHRSMEAISQSLAEVGIATFRYNFVYMEAGRGAPDRHPLLLATVRAAVQAAHEAAPDLPLIAGGKSMGGRMTSMAQAENPLSAMPVRGEGAGGGEISISSSAVRGLVFYGFPLHPAGRPGVERAEHLAKVNIPMLFLQGTRDDLADLSLLTPIVEGLKTASTHIVETADHSFHIQKSSGKTDAQVLNELVRKVRDWCGSALDLPGAIGL